MTLRYIERPPSSASLRRDVERVWLVAGEPGPGLRRPERVVPDACPELIVHLGDRFERLVGSRWRRQPRVFLAGTLTRPWLLRPGRRVRTVGVRFRPGAAPSFLPLDMRSATDREVELARLLGGRSTRELVANLEGSRSRAGLFAALERWLLARSASPRPSAESARRGVARILARRGVARVLACRGRERIEDLARTLGSSRRTLERAFARDLGISPKRFARIVRLNAVLASLGEAERARAVDLALEAGYFDQAHLARDFRAVAGRRSTEARETDGELARHFTAPERLKSLLSGD